MNYVDIFLLAVLGAWAIVGAVKGAFGQIIGIAAGVLGLWASTEYLPQIISTVMPDASMTRGVIALVLTTVIIALTYAIGSLIGDKISAIANQTPLGIVDRIGGLFVGVFNGAITIWVFSSIIAFGPIPTLAGMLHQSRVAIKIQDLMPTQPELVGRLNTYFDTRGFTQAFVDIGAQVIPLELSPPPTSAVVGLAESAGRASTVKVAALGCALESQGSGVVIGDGRVVTNAHVVAGSSEVWVTDVSGKHPASVVAFDPYKDVAVIDVPGSSAQSIRWSDRSLAREMMGATLGYPGDSTSITVRPAGVRQSMQASGYDIYGDVVVNRRIAVISSPVRAGDSGGPFVLDDGTLGGIVFAASSMDPDVGYVLPYEEVRPVIDRAGNDPVPTGSCKFE